ncbi:MAG TPA: cytochrome c oxidase subunit 3 [bacterium]|jgi:heme/copper-type cytochrome/quinol oxidase subunit 3
MSSVVIPYIDSPRPDTGLYNAKVGIWLFLASEIMLFGALFSSYVLLRVGAPAGTWPVGASVLNVPLATFNTVLLITSTVTMLLAWASCKVREFGKFRLYLGLTVLLGVVFLVVKGFEYSMKLDHHLYPSTNTFLAIYFTMTGLHGLHVLGGVVVNAYFWGPGSKMWHTAPNQFTNRIESAGLYWHFVDMVWIFLFPVLYLL